MLKKRGSIEQTIRYVEITLYIFVLKKMAFVYTAQKKRSSGVAALPGR